MSARSARRTAPEPPKKSKAPLIILIVVIIVVVLTVIIIIIIVLVRRSSSTTTSCTTNADCGMGKVCSGGTCITPSTCTTNADCGTGKICQSGACITPTTCTTNSQCPSGKVCNTQAGVCVTCNANSDCSGATPACVNNNCLACAINTDCPTATPICTSNNTCIQCNANADCSGNTVYSSQGLNVCNNHVCVGCLTNTDCTSPATCVSGACCDLTPPNLTYGCTATMSTIDTISGTFSYVQPSSKVTYKVKIMSNMADFVGSISGSTMTVTTFDTTQYPLKVGQYIFGPYVTGLPKITALGTGTGGTGTYTIDTSQTVASGILTSQHQIYVSPSPLTTSASPQAFSVTNGNLGTHLEPNCGYWVGIEMTVTCGSVKTPVNSNWGYAGSPSFATGPYPVTGWVLMFINNVNNTFQVEGYLSGLDYDTTQKPQMYISKWRNLSPALMGVLDNTLVDRGVSQGADLNPLGGCMFCATWAMSFGSLVHTSGQTWYAGIKPWGPTSFWDWASFSAVNP